MFNTRKTVTDKSVELKKNENLNSTEEIFWKNEVEANLLVSTIMFFVSALLVLVWVGTHFKIFDLDPDITRKVCGAGLIEMLIPATICRYYKGENKWLKYLMLLVFVVVQARIDSLLGFNVPLCMVLGLVMSVRYFSHRFTELIAEFTAILFTISAYVSCRFHTGPLDMNFYFSPERTILEEGESIYIHFAGSDVIMPKYVKYYMQQSYLPKFLLFLVVALACVMIAKRAHNMVLEQAAFSEQNTRMESELSTATKIQFQVLPKTFPAFPEKEEFNLYASMNPAREVGGDFYDFFMVDDTHLAVVIADVSGKGVPAALFMMIARTVVKTQAQMRQTPAVIFRQVNDFLCENNENNMFVTAWLGLLDITTGELTYVNAGHNPPVLKQADQGFAYLKQRPGFILAGMEGFPYREYQLQLQAGDRLFLYTDGVTEAFSDKDEMFGEERLLNYLNANQEATTENLLMGLTDELHRFIGEADQSDDITMLVLDIKK